MTPTDIIYQRRVRVLDHARQTGNVARTCRTFGISRKTFYEWRDRAERYGLEALMPKARRAPQMPTATPTWVVNELLTMAVTEPTIGCRQYADRLADRAGHQVRLGVDQHRLARHRGDRAGDLAAGQPAADHRDVELHSGDTVVFSATPVPGNERAVNETIDRLYQIGCDVVTARDAPIHASGHGYAEELKMMLNLTRPRYVMPVHGDFKRMLLHSQLAESVGVPAEDIFRVENGTPLEIDSDGARVGEPETAGLVFVDGVDIGDVADVALRDRRMLSGDGILIIYRGSDDPGRWFGAVAAFLESIAFADDETPE